jgi:hypothetical protein
MKYLFFSSLFLIFNLHTSCNSKTENNTVTQETTKQETAKNSSAVYSGKTTSLIDVNAADNFEDQGYGAIDSNAVKKLFEEIFKGTYSVYKDDANKTALSIDEIKSELKNSYNQNIKDQYKKNFFIENKGEKIPMRDIIHLLSKDSIYIQNPGFQIIRKTQEIAVVAQTYDQTGEERGKRILFWINLNPKNPA